jgi:hypothetical protein
MRQAYAYQAVLTGVEDPAAPGAAITVALCGAIDHDPPCPLAPHHTAAARDGATVTLRILFATAPDRVHQVHHLIDRALGDGPWRLVRSGCADVAPADRDHARRLLKPQAPRSTAP